MHEVSVGEINAITRPTVLYTHTNELKTTELADAETNPNENHGDNSATPSLGTHPSSPYSPLTDTADALVEPLPRPWVDAGDAAVLARAGNLPGVRLQGDDNILFGVSQY